MEQGIEASGKNLLDAEAEIANKVLQDSKKVSSMLNSVTAMNQINDESISSLLYSGQITNSESLKILKILNDKEYSNAEELINLISDNGTLDLFNKDLDNIVKRGLSNSDYIRTMQNISQTNLVFNIESTNVINIEDILRRESLKEVMLRESFGGYKAGIENLENVLQNSNLSLEQSKNLRYLANWSIMQKNLKLYNDVDSVYELNQLIGRGAPLETFDDLLTVSGTFRNGFSNMLDDLYSRTNVLESVIGNINETYINEYNNYSFMKESALSRLGQVKSINDAIKIAGEAKREIFAGRNNLNDYTTLTQIPQFMVSRLS